MKILIKFPTRKRPQIFLNTFDLYNRWLSGKHDVQFVVTMDHDDESMNNQAIYNKLDSYKNVKYCYGYSKNKIQAVNANMEDEQNWDILILASDDMIPICRDYDDIIAQDMLNHYPDLSGGLHYNDGKVGQVLCTLSIMGKKLYDHYGYIYHPDYTSLWCDNEFTDTAKAMNKLTYIDKIVIRHSWKDLTGDDAMASHNGSFYEKDRLVYEARKAKGFPKESIGGLATRPTRSRRP